MKSLSLLSQFLMILTTFSTQAHNTPESQEKPSKHEREFHPFKTEEGPFSEAMIKKKIIKEGEKPEKSEKTVKRITFSDGRVQTIKKISQPNGGTCYTCHISSPNVKLGFVDSGQSGAFTQVEQTRSGLRRDFFKVPVQKILEQEKLEQEKNKDKKDKKVLVDLKFSVPSEETIWIRNIQTKSKFPDERVLQSEAPSLKIDISGLSEEYLELDVMYHGEKPCTRVKDSITEVDRTILKHGHRIPPNAVLKGGPSKNNQPQGSKPLP